MIRRPLLLLTAIVVLGLVFARAALPPRPPAALGAFGHGPTVVLVHGLGSRAEHWLPVARDLARDHRVVLVELPGHGIAAMPRGLTLDDAALALDRALAEQGDGPVVLVGHSVGGLVAAAEALRAPRRVRALVLVETALRPQLDGADRGALLASLEKDYRGTLRASYESFGRDSAQGAALYAEAVQLDSTAMKSWIRLAVSADLSHAITGLKIPLLVVLSSRSWPGNESWAACGDTLGYRGVPDVTTMRVENTGHFVMLDRPSLLAGAIRRFAAQGSPPAFAALFGF